MLTKLFRGRPAAQPGEPPSSTQAADLSPEAFKDVFARLASSVAVVTFHIGRHVHGFTATSLTPVSAAPPIALFCVSRNNESHRHLAIGSKVGISILAADQNAISERFAGKTGIGGYADIAVFEAAPGIPLITAAIAGLGGTIHELIPAGDHSIYLCRLASGVLGAGADPLLYFSRDYYGLGGALRCSGDHPAGMGPDLTTGAALQGNR